VPKLPAESPAKKRLSRLRQKPPRPENHADMKLGEGWHKRNFLTEVIIPSFFIRRRGRPTQSPVFPELTGDQIGITWIGHASFLIQTPEHNILVDPNWAKWLKIIKRIKHPGIEIRDLPSIDLVLVTHAHFDHLDRRTLRAVAADQPIVVPEHVGELVHDLGFNHVRELARWESLQLGDLKITLTPAHHWGARMLHDSHRGFGGFLLEYRGRSVLHCGDSAYFDGFKEIGERHHVEIALLPIGAYEAPSRRDVHMNPEQAIQAFVELRAEHLIPMHYGTFRLSFEPMLEPPRRLRECAKKLGLLDKIHILREGMPGVF